MNLDHYFDQVSKLSEDQQKKDLHQKWNTFFAEIQLKTKKKSSPNLEHFFPRIQVDTYAHMYTRVKLLGGCRCRPYLNYWGGYSQIIGEIYPLHPPQGFGTPASSKKIFCRTISSVVAFEEL